MARARPLIRPIELPECSRTHPGNNFFFLAPRLASGKKGRTAKKTSVKSRCFSPPLPQTKPQTSPRRISRPSLDFLFSPHSVFVRCFSSLRHNGCRSSSDSRAQEARGILSLLSFRPRWCRLLLRHPRWFDPRRCVCLILAELFFADSGSTDSPWLLLGRR